MNIYFSSVVFFFVFFLNTFKATPNRQTFLETSHKNKKRKKHTILQFSRVQPLKRNKVPNEICRAERERKRLAFSSTKPTHLAPIRYLAITKGTVNALIQLVSLHHL